MSVELSRRNVLKMCAGGAAGFFIAGKLGFTDTLQAQSPNPDLSETEIDFDPNFVYRGLMRANNIRRFKSGSDVFPEGVKQWETEYSDRLGSRVTDYAFRTITDSLVDGGLNHTDQDMEHYTSTFDSLLQNKKVNELFNIKNDSLTFGFMGAEHDRDASAALAAIAISYATHSDLFTNQNGEIMTITEAFQNHATLSLILVNQGYVLSRTQYESLETSQAEIQRRADVNSADASRLLPITLQKSDQYTSCSTYMSDADSRDKQGMNSRVVEHKADNMNTFGKSNSEEHNVGFLGTVNTQTGAFEIRAINDRSYAGEGKAGSSFQGETDNAVFELEFSCAAPVQPAVQPTPSSTRQQSGQPNPENTNILPTQPGAPTAAPTNSEYFTRVPSPVATTNPNDIPPTNFLG